MRDGDGRMFRPQEVWLWLARIGLAIALAITLVLAFAPPSPGPGLLPWDKAEHFLAFYVLTGLSAAAFPGGRIWIVVAAMLALGAGIEIVQGLPFVHRDADVHDWLADGVGVVFALAPMLLSRWRREAGGPSAEAARP